MTRKRHKGERKDRDMSEAKLTNKELWRVFRHQLTIRGANNYERQQNAGFTEAMMPVIEKYYDDPEEKKEAYARHMEYFLTNDITSAIPVGVAAAMEERYATERDIDPDSINAVKTALMGPLAGLGDSLLNGTARPILAGLAISFVSSGLGWFGPIFFVIGMAIVSLGVRYLGVFQGYKQGVKFVEKIQSSGLISKISDPSEFHFLFSFLFFYRFMPCQQNKCCTGSNSLAKRMTQPDHFISKHQRKEQCQNGRQHNTA